MIFCSRCGKQTLEKNNYCEYCGSELPSAAKKNHLVNGIIIGSGIVLVLLGLFGWFGNVGVFHWVYGICVQDSLGTYFYVLRQLLFELSFFSVFFLFGIVFLVLGFLGEKGKINNVRRKKLTALDRVAGGLGGGGGALLGITWLDIISNYYLQSQDAYLLYYVYVPFAAIGFVMVGLSIYFYWRSMNRKLLKNRTNKYA